jgi:hypothetical protein
LQHIEIDNEEASRKFMSKLPIAILTNVRLCMIAVILLGFADRVHNPGGAGNEASLRLADSHPGTGWSVGAFCIN